MLDGNVKNECIPGCMPCCKPENNCGKCKDNRNQTENDEYIELDEQGDELDKQGDELDKQGDELDEQGDELELDEQGDEPQDCNQNLTEETYKKYFTKLPESLILTKNAEYDFTPSFFVSIPFNKLLQAFTLITTIVSLALSSQILLGDY